ncbi:MAG: tetratricopeptide repeat protein [Bryobacteraceae bacterium]
MDLRRIFLGVLLASVSVFIQSAAADTYSIILHGKVVMEDGSVPPVVAIERVCSDAYGSAPGPITNKKGEYIWRMDIDPLEARNCVLRATHTGFSSSVVEVSGIDTIHTTFQLPPITIYPSVADPYTLNVSETGISGRAKGDWKAAIKAMDAQNLPDVASHLEAVVAASPKAWQAWHGLGVIDERLNKLPEARAAYEHAIEDDPKMLQPRLTLARLCIKTKDWNCAATAAEGLIKEDSKHPYPEIYLHLAVARYELKDLDGAQKSVEEAIHLDPQMKRPRAEYVLGRILEAKGDVAGAKEHMTKYLQLEPAPADIDLVRAHIDDLGKPARGVDPDLEVL